MTGVINPKVVSFTAPTQYLDDTSIPANGIARYEYGFSQSPTGPFSQLVVDTDFTPDADGKQTGDINVSGFAFGQWYAAGRPVSTDGKAAAWSNVVPFEVQPKEPKPITNFSIA